MVKSLVQEEQGSEAIGQKERKNRKE